MSRQRTVRLRILLSVLIFLNMAMIFQFSAQNGEESAKTSNTVTRTVAEVVVTDFEERTEPEQAEILQRMSHPVRKLAHFGEHGLLGVWFFLLLLTWKNQIFLRYLASILSVFLYACTDEFHQSFSDGRAMTFTDVLIDTLGALFTCTCILLILLWVRREKKIRTNGRKPKLTEYRLPAQIDRDLTVAVASDLHGNSPTQVVEALKQVQPDLILIPGDLADHNQLGKNPEPALDFLRTCASIAPTFYTLGNHETACFHHGNPFAKPKKKPLPEGFVAKATQTGAVFLEDESVVWHGITVCGLSSGLNGRKNEPNQTALKEFDRTPGYRILLCHHPEYYRPYLAKTSVELIVCGHAHGGHWRIFGIPIYAPGQGLFPRYASGIRDGRCIISRGLGDHTRIPRIGNPVEMPIIRLQAMKK